MATTAQPSDLLMLHLLGRCNLECAHCYMEGAPGRTEKLPLTRVLRAVAACPGLGIRNLVLTGGEPLLYPELDTVLAAASQNQDLMITLCSNATLLTERRLARWRPFRLRLNISIDGAPGFHDAFRRLPGAFALAERGARAAVAAGLPVTIISSMSRGNLDQLKFLVGWARDIGAEQFLAQPLLQLGRGEAMAAQCLSFAELNRMILTLSDLSNAPGSRRLPCQVIGARKSFLLDHPCAAFVRNGTGCHRGVTQEIRKIVVREDGTVLPEVPNLSSRYALGNLHERDLPDLRARYFAQGYAAFDRLCRAAYAELLPGWDCIIVPWEQMLAERSRHPLPEQLPDPPLPTCGGGPCGRYGQAARGERSYSLQQFSAASTASP